MRITPLDSKDQDYFDDLRHKIVCSKGGWVVGEAVYNQGYSMLEELVGEISYFQLYVLNITGRLIDEKLAKWIEAFFGSMSWPDPRIWCNQIAALCGSSKTEPSSAAIAGILASDSKLYGPGVISPICKFIQEACIRKYEGVSVERIIEDELQSRREKGSKKPVVIGFSRPIATGDERVPVLRKVARKLGFEEGPHEVLANEIDQYVHDKHDEGINVGGYSAAFLSDQGFSQVEVFRLITLIVNSGVQACYAEYYDKPINGFLPLACEDIEYTGPSEREFKKD